jgi:hypothetical protein
LAKILIERIGLDKKELELISNKYSVSALQLVEMIPYGKYRFVYEDKMTG